MNDETVQMVPMLPAGIYRSYEQFVKVSKIVTHYELVKLI